MNGVEVKKIAFFDNKKNSSDYYPPVINLTKNEKIKKILIIKWGALGDLLISSAIMNDIASAFLNSEIHLNTSPEFIDLFMNDNRFSNIWAVEVRKSQTRILNNISWVNRVIKYQYDLIIDLQTNDHSRLLLSFVKILSLNSPKFILGNHSVYPYNIRFKRDGNVVHSFDIQRATIASIGIIPSTNLPILTQNNKEKNQVRTLMKKYSLSNKGFIVFIPGSNSKGSLKRWGVANYRELSSILGKSMQQKIVLIGSKDDTEECQRISFDNPNVINLCNLTKLSYLPEIFRHSSLIVSNDTGTAHLTGLANVTTLLINGPTDPLKVMPIGQNIYSIQADIECKNCYLKYCSHHSCMINLKPNIVSKFIKNINNV